MALCLSAVFTRGTQYADEEPLFAGRGFSVCEAAFAYHPRHPEESVLYHVVAENIESFLARQQERGRVVPGLWNANCARFLIAEFWPEVLCGFTATSAAWTAPSRILASIEAFVRRVEAGAWPIRRPISWTMYFPKSRCGNGCCLFPSRFAIVLPTILLWSEMCCRSSCAPSLPRSDGAQA